MAPWIIFLADSDGGMKAGKDRWNIPGVAGRASGRFFT